MDERKTIREVIDLEVKASHCGRDIRVDVYEMSVMGCMIASRNDELLEAGAAIALDLGAGGTVCGTLVWNKGNVGGVRFDTDLEDGVMGTLRPHRTTAFDNTFRDRFGRPLAALQRRFTARSSRDGEPTVA